MTAYRLPSMERIAQTRIPTDDNSSIADVQIVDGVVYADYLHDTTPLRTARWDLNTNAVTILAKTVLAWGFGGGSMLRVTGDGYSVAEISALLGIPLGVAWAGSMIEKGQAV